jgi:hypothetical protein
VGKASPRAAKVLTSEAAHPHAYVMLSTSSFHLQPDIDGDDLVEEPSLLEHYSRLVAVVRRPRVAIDHFILPMNVTERGLRI